MQTACLIRGFQAIPAAIAVCGTLAVSNVSAALMQGSSTEYRNITFPENITFSIDFQGPTAPDRDEGAILAPNMPLPIEVVGSADPNLGTYERNLGIIPTELGYREVNALSYGRDRGMLYFSVDEFAVGIPGSPSMRNVFTEGAEGAMEASADVFRYLGQNAPWPIDVPPSVIGNKQVIDGTDLGLQEPNRPTLGSYSPPAGQARQAPDPRDPGDNLDALDIGTTPSDLKGPIYFSLDSGFVDPLETFYVDSEPSELRAVDNWTIGPPPPNTGTAVANGFVGGDVIVNVPDASNPSGTNLLYLAASDLGLDLYGRDTDDLNALVLWTRDNSDPTSFNPDTDRIEFSVRRNSAIIGTPDSRLGLGIEEGDILTLPTEPGLAPSILIPAEALGLVTVRSGGGTSWGVPNPRWDNQDVWADDLNAATKVPEPSILALLLAGFGGLTGIRLIRKSRSS